MGRTSDVNFTEREVWINWHFVSAIFGINHGCATAPLIFATTLLDKRVGYEGSALLYVFTCLGSLFVSVPLVSWLGQRLGLFLGMSLYCLYVGSFAVAAALPVGSALQWALFLPGSCMGGIAASLLWTAQGGLIDRHATNLLVARAAPGAAGEGRQQATAALSSCFAVYYLLLEVACKLAASLALQHGCAPGAIFLVCLGLATVSAWASLHMREMLASPGAADAVSVPVVMVSRCAGIVGKLLKAAGLWTDPALWLLSFTNLAFGFSAAFMNGYVNLTYTKSQLGTEWVGYYASTTALTGALVSYIFGALAQRLGTKCPFIFIGSLCFLAIPALVLFVGLDGWGYWLVVPYLLQGCGRGVFESINKGVFADFFPGDRAEGAFANVMMQTTLSFAVCFFFSSVLERSTLATIILVLAGLATPGYLAVRTLRLRQARRARQKSPSSDEETSDDTHDVSSSASESPDGEVDCFN